MTSNSRLLRVSLDCYLQIRKLSQIRKLPMADVVREMAESSARSENQSGRWQMPQTYRIYTDDQKRIRLNISDLSNFRLSIVEAKQLVQNIKKVIAGGSLTREFDGEVLKIARIGKGMLFEVTHSNGRKTRKTTSVGFAKEVLDFLHRETLRYR